jgi:hypothetical protein
VADQWAGALYLVPVIVAAVVAYVVTRPSKKSTAAAAEEPDALAPVIPLPRTTTYNGIERRMGSRRPSPANAHPTLFHAALSSHLSAVSRPPPASATAATNASLAAFQSARLVSSRRPARIPRRPSHQCPRKPE